MSKKFPSSDECLRRLRDNDPEALVPLVEALEREQDPRAYALQRRIEDAMEAVSNPPLGADFSANAVFQYQLACLFAVRLMTPDAARVAGRMSKM